MPLHLALTIILLASPRAEGFQPSVFSPRAQGFQPSVLSADPSTPPIVATINHEPITLPEFRLHLLANRANVAASFNRRYNAQDSPDFWTRSFNGEVPLETLKKTTLDQLLRIKIHQLLAREQGLLDDPSWPAFLASLERENLRRKNALDQGQPIYGPTRYSPRTWYNYTFSNLTLRLREKLAHQWRLSDAQLQSLYQQNRQLYRRQDAVTVRTIALPFGRERTFPTSEHALQTAHRILQQLEAGADFPNLARTHATDPHPTCRTFDPNSAFDDVRTCPRLREEALNLQPGQVSPPVLEQDLETVFILQCLTRTPTGFQPLDEVAPRLQADHVQTCLGQLVDQRLAAANIRINHDLLDRIAVRGDLPTAPPSP